MEERMQENEIILVDGHSLLFKAFFGIPARIIGTDNKPIHGVLGFIGILLKVVASFEPKYLLVVFDSEKGSFRQEIDSNYKKDRIQDWSELPNEENPFSQLSGIKKSLDYLNWKHCEVAGVEADDVLAAYTRKYHKSHHLVIVSTDSDLLQLVNENVKVFHPHGKKSVLYTPDKVQEKLGVEPTLIPDIKALMGDKTDSIQGIPGVGIKTAQKLISQFGHIEDLYEQTSAIKPAQLQNKVVDNRALVMKNVTMIRLNQSVNLPFELDTLRIGKDSWTKKTMYILRETELLE
jgi:DNA polymerase-1